MGRSAKRKSEGKVHDSTSQQVDKKPDVETATEHPAKKQRSSGKNIDKDNPFPELMRPKQEECHAARDGLALLHGEPSPPPTEDSGESDDHSILDSLVRTILSQNTTDTNSNRTFANLKKDFEGWEAIRTAPSEKVEAAIKLGGLAAVKTQRIKEILDSVKEDQGSCTLEHLRKLPNEEIKEALLGFKGVGPKTAACVLMFSMGRFEFPVDTHVWRIAKNLGWVPKTATREQTYTHLNARIPDEIKYSLHILMVEHGKRCKRCAKNGKPRKESHGPCPLINLSHAADTAKPLDAENAAQDAKEAKSLKEEDIAKEKPEPKKVTRKAKEMKVKKENIGAEVKKEDVKVKKEDDS